MSAASDYSSLPQDLPAPVDDGACAHLAGARLPRVSLASTLGEPVDLGRLAGRVAIFAYPMTGRPGVALPDGWDAIPGARGCTPQNCALRDTYRAFLDLDVTVLAVSTQDTAYQREMAERLHLPYPVLSDVDFALANALRLPTFGTDGMRLIRRLTLIVGDGTIEHVLYPVFPSDRAADQALDWLRAGQPDAG